MQFQVEHSPSAGARSMRSPGRSVPCPAGPNAVGVRVLRVPLWGGQWRHVAESCASSPHIPMAVPSELESMSLFRERDGSAAPSVLLGTRFQVCDGKSAHHRKAPSRPRSHREPSPSVAGTALGGREGRTPGHLLT